jgi:hypothetical protein
MRSRSLVVAVVACLSLAACSDSPPTGSSLVPFGHAPANLTLGQYIDQQIVELLPTGHERSVGARWSTVQRSKSKGDMAGAVKHFNSLADWLDKKTNDFTPPSGTTKPQAAAHLVVSMATWLYEGPAASPPAPVGADVAIAIAPAGQPFLLQTPSEHAGLSWPAGSTNEDRLIVLAQDPTPYPEVCSGPLVTRRCQYPLFYTAHSYPDLRLNQKGRFAVCMVETGDRRPLEYPDDETGARPIDGRLRLAHDLPENPADYTEGATQEDGIEILPKAEQQTGELVDCDEPDKQAMGRLERTLYAASKFVGKIISPKNAWAWDSGPEHEFEAFSHFNGVDPQSEPDLALSNVTITPIPAATDLGMTLAYTVTNESRREGGDATASSPAATMTAYQSNDAELDAGDPVIVSAPVPALAPDAAPHTASHTFIPGDYSYVIVRVSGAASEISMSNNVVALPLYASEPETGPNTVTSAQQSVIDHEVGFLAIGSPVSQQRLAQVFTAPATGLLTQVSFPVSCGADEPLIVEIQEAAPGYPKGAILSTTTVPSSSLPPFAPGAIAFRDITLSQAAAVVQGQQYGIVLTTRDRRQSACAVAQGPTGDPYAGGSGWHDTVQNQLGVWVRMSPRDDLPFKTVVTVPMLR